MIFICRNKSLKVQLNMQGIRDSNYVLLNNLRRNILHMASLWQCIQVGLILQLLRRQCLIFIRSLKRISRAKMKELTLLSTLQLFLMRCWRMANSTMTDKLQISIWQSHVQDIQTIRQNYLWISSISSRLDKID